MVQVSSRDKDGIRTPDRQWLIGLMLVGCLDRV